MDSIVPTGTDKQHANASGRAQAAVDRLRRDVNDNVLTIPCPACNAEPGDRCVTMIDGVDTGWHHDVRFYVANGWRHVEDGDA